MDSLFGKQLLSLRAISVSGCLSIASGLFVVVFDVLIFPTAPKQSISVFLAVLGGGLFFIVAALLPAVKSVNLSVAPLFAFALGLVGLTWLTVAFHQTDLAPPFFFGLILGIPTDFLCIYVGRRLLALIQRSSNLVHLIVLVAATLVLPVVTFVAPYSFVNSDASLYSSDRVTTLLGSFSTANAISALLSVLFAALATIAVLHRLIWPFLRRPVMAAHRHGLLKQRKLLWTIGVGLIAVSTSLGGRVMAYLHSHFGL